MKIVAFGIVGLLLWSPFGFSQETPKPKKNQYTISLSGVSLAELNRVKNCVDYLVCENALSQIFRSVVMSTMNIKLEATHSEISQIIHSCVEPYPQFNPVVTDSSGAAAELSFGTSRMKSGIVKSPIILEPESAEKVFLAKTKMDQMMLLKDYNGAISFASTEFGINYNGYKVSYDPLLKDYAITTHENATIRVGTGFMESACDLILALRHESEHVAQMKRANECKALGMKSAFNDHLYRERSAYLNDILNVPTYCHSPRKIKVETDFRYQYLFERYGNVADPVTPPIATSIKSSKTN